MSRILIVSAIMPAVILMTYVYKKDHTTKEPLGLLLLLIGGGIVAALLAGRLESLGEIILSSTKRSVKLYNFLYYFFVVALAEEGCKYLLLRKISWSSNSFDSTYDGIIYATFISLGFALYENILYVFRYGLSVAITRAFTAIPGHFCFGVLMGVFYGAAKRYSNMYDEENRKQNGKLALLVPILVHGLYDYLIVSNAKYSSLLFIVGLILLIISCVKIVKKVSAHDIDI